MAVNDPVPTPIPGAPPTFDARVDPAAAAALDRAALELAQRTDREPSPELLPAVMHTVRAELRPGQRIPFPGSNGTLFITETAAGNALVAQIDGLAGFVVRRCTVLFEPAATRPDAQGVPNGTTGGIRVTLTAAITYGADIELLLTGVRSVIAATALDLIGLAVSQVDIDIVDIHPTAGQHR